MTVATTYRYSILRHRFENLPSSPLTLAIRFTGVLELKEYIGGTPGSGNFLTGGTPAADNRMVVKMEVPGDSNTYYLNRSATPPANGCVNVDYTQNVIVKEGDVIVITLDNQDLTQYSGDTGGVAVTNTYDGVAYLSQWIGVVYTHANKVWRKGGGVRDAKWRSFTENIYGVKAEK